MKKITKKILNKRFKKIYNKAFRKAVQEHVKAVAIGKLGDDGSDHIVIDNISLEITSDNPEIMASSTESASKASARCFYYCYVIGGERICRKICY
ncbi:MAG: hypothetical protein WBN81_00655 [Gammaproteobacteria bacterium]